MKDLEKPFTNNFFEAFAIYAAKATGSTTALIVSCVMVLAWLITGPIFHFSNSWLLAINTGTSVITFLMVFIIQKSQNKDSLAMQVKLNELVAANALASNRIISVEDLTEAELVVLNNYYTKLAAMVKEGKVKKSSHSIEDAIQNLQAKKSEPDVEKKD